MNSPEPPQQRPEESLTLIIKKPTRNIFFAKILILLGLSLGFGYWFARDSSQRYETGRELTQEKYLERFDEYKGNLISRRQQENPVLSTLVMFITMSFLIGSYELTALMIGLMIEKMIRR
jgi:hypothetical protein